MRGRSAVGSIHGVSSQRCGRGDSDVGAPASTGVLNACLGPPPCPPGACRAAQARRGLTGRGAAIPRGLLLAPPPPPRGLSHAVISVHWTHQRSEPRERAVRREGWARMCAHTSPPCGPFPLCNYSGAPPLRLPPSGEPRLHPNEALAQARAGPSSLSAPGASSLGRYPAAIDVLQLLRRAPDTA